MADQDSSISLWGGTTATDKPKTTAQSKPETKATPKAGLNLWGASQSSSEDAHPSPPPGPDSGGSKYGSFLTTPISEQVAGTSFSKEYDKIADQLFPESFRKEKGNSWMGRFGRQLSTAAPEVLDFVQSPLGLSLIAAHMFPATAPFAAVVDVGLGGMGAMQAIPQVQKAFTENTPEAWADAVKGIAMSAGMVKAGLTNLAIRTKAFNVEPLEQRVALKEGIETKRPSQGALDRIAERSKQDPAVVLDWSSKPLSEISKAKKSAEAQRKALKDKYGVPPEGSIKHLPEDARNEIIESGRKIRMLDDISKKALATRVTANEKAGKLPDQATLAQRVSRTAYDSNLWREPAKMVSVPRPRLMEVSSDIVADRAAFLASRNFDINRLLYDFKREVPISERDVTKLGYVIQGDLTPDQAGLGPEAKKWLPEIRKWTTDQDAMLREAHGNDLPLQESENYLSQAWDMSELGVPERKRAARQLMNDPHLKKRTIESYKKGIEEYGLKPLFPDVADLLKRRADFAVKAVANRRMAQTLRDVGVLLTENEYKKVSTDRPWKKAEDAVPLYRAAYSNRPMEGGTIMKPVYVHPDYYDAVNSVFGKSWDHPAFQAFDTMRASLKKVSLGFSMFHHWALSEQAMAISALRNNPGETASKLFFVNPEFYKGVKTGLWEAIGRQGERPPVMRMKPETVHGWIDSGLNLKSEDAEQAVFGRFEKAKNSANALVRGASKVSHAWDTALWDFYHQGMMLDAVETIWADESRNLGENPSPSKVKELKRTISEHVNNAFGSISYEKMLISPKGRQVLNTALLAPAWTLSNLRVLTSGYENEASFRIADKYVKGAALSFFLTAQAMNMALTGWYSRNDKDGMKMKPSWENSGAPMKIAGHYVQDLSENAFNIYAGKNSDGSDRYIVFGKGFREPFGWLTAPIQTLSGKLAQPIRAAIAQISGASPGSGYKEIDFNAPAEVQAAQRVASAVDNLGTPFVLRDPVKAVLHKAYPTAIDEPGSSSQFLSLPTRKGLSFTRALQGYRDAMDSGRTEEARKVLEAAVQNGINPAKIIAQYRTDTRKNLKKEMGVK